MPPDKSNITGVVLAGGSARRMGGANKALSIYKGRPLIDYALANLAPHAEQIIISANRDQEAFTELGYDVVDDGQFMHLGPLAGIHAALEQMNTDYLAIAACDQLTIPARVYAHLIEQVTDASGCYAVSGDTRMPTCAVIPHTLGAPVRQYLKDSKLRLMQFMCEYCRAIRFDDVQFENINTSADLDSISAGAGK